MRTPLGAAPQAVAISSTVRRPLATCVNRSSSIAARSASVRWNALTVSKNRAGDEPVGGIGTPVWLLRRTPLGRPCLREGEAPAEPKLMARQEPRPPENRRSPQDLDGAVAVTSLALRITAIGLPARQPASVFAGSVPTATFEAPPNYND